MRGRLVRMSICIKNFCSLQKKKDKWERDGSGKLSKLFNHQKKWNDAFTSFHKPLALTMTFHEARYYLKLLTFLSGSFKNAAYFFHKLFLFHIIGYNFVPSLSVGAYLNISFSFSWRFQFK